MPMHDIPHHELTTFTRKYFWDRDHILRPWDGPLRGAPLDTGPLPPDERRKVEGSIAVHAAYHAYIAALAARLALKHSILCVCDKSLAPELVEWVRICDEMRGFEFLRLEFRPSSPQGGSIHGMVNSLHQLLASASTAAARIIVIDHLDLMTTTLEGHPSPQANEIVYLLAEFKDVPVLAFADPEMPLPKVIEDVFTEKRILPPLDREDLHCLLRPEEAMRISRGCLTVSDQLRLYQYVSGMNVIRLRWLMRLISAEFGALNSPADAQAVFQRIRSLTTLGDVQIPAVEETNIAGYDMVKKDLRKRVILPMEMRNTAATPAALAQADQIIPKGVILFGPPRNGKTEMARWLATELSWPLIVVRGPELKNMYVGETERAIRRTFSQARKVAPAIILIDELDALTPVRDNNASRAEVSMVAMLLTEMDGLSKDESIVVIGTTNRLEAVDPAFKAPGRFGVLIHVDYPSKEDSLAILQHYRTQMHLEGLSDPALQYLVERTQGDLDAQEEEQRKNLRDALVSMYDPRFVLKAGPAFQQYLESRLGIGRAPRWSCDHLRGICREILVEMQWELKENGRLPDINAPEFLDRIMAAIRCAAAPASEQGMTMPLENLAGGKSWRTAELEDSDG